jgi:ATP-dependent Lon protease
MKSPSRQQFDPDQASDPAGGFSLIRRFDPETLSHGVKLLVPTQLKDLLEAEELERLKNAGAAREDERRRQQASSPQGNAGAPENHLPESAQQPVRSEATAENRMLGEEQDRWDQHAAAALHETGRRRRYPVFDPEQGMALYRRMRLYLKEDRQRYEVVYEHLKTLGHLRAIARPAPDALRQLALAQPHMAAVVEFVQERLELARRSRRPPRIPPILLVGEPGIGKTHFAQGLARALSAPLSIQRLDTDLTGALMLGSDRKFGNSQHGLLFELLALGQAANPVVVLDEIDKINRQRDQVQASLYSLLEPVSACHLRDISLEFELDARLVTWIATANEAQRLDPPLRSRFREFHIQVPSAEQSLILAAEVIRATVREMGVRGFRAEPQRLERHLAHLTARQIQQITQEAMARALKAGRRHLQREDLPPELLGEPGAHGPLNYLH